MILKFEIVEGNLKITNLANGSVVLLFSKQNIGAMANIVVEETSPVILYNIALGYNGIIFKDTLDNCVDSTETPFTPETWLLFCELNLGFNTPGASGTITVTDSYLTLPAASTQSGKFYWCQNSEGVYLTGLYYSNGTTWETSEADDIKVVANYDALPDPTTVPGQFYWCENSQGTKWLPGSLGGTYYNSGMYYSNGTSWTFLNVPYQATQAEVNAGLNDDKFVTPNTLANSSQLAAKSDKADLYVKSLTSDVTTKSKVQLATNLSFPIGANEVWTVEFNLMGGCSSSGGIRITINTPVGSSGSGGIIGTNNATLATQSIAVNSLSTAFGLGNSNSPQRIYLTIRNGATPGNVVFSYASNSSGQTSIIKANSYLIATKSILV